MATRKPKPKPKARQAPAKKAPPLKTLLANLISLKRAKEQLSAKLAALQKVAGELEDEVLQNFSEQDISSVRVKGGLATRVVEVVPQVEDWDLLYGYITRENAYELLQKRVTATAWRERVEAGNPVPGVTTFNRVYLKLTLVK